MSDASMISDPLDPRRGESLPSDAQMTEYVGEYLEWRGLVRTSRLFSSELASSSSSSSSSSSGGGGGGAGPSSKRGAVHSSAAVSRGQGRRAPLQGGGPSGTGAPQQRSPSTKQEKSPEQIMNVLRNAFKKGDASLFFGAWDRYIPVPWRKRREVGPRMEFNLRLYFALFPRMRIVAGTQKGKPIDKQLLKDARDRMLEFKAFLESRSSEFSTKNDCLPFFAIPYVEEPQSHPSFAHLFLPEWREELFHEFEEFAGFALADPHALPRLVEIVMKENQVPAELKLLEYDFASKLRNRKEIHIRLYNLCTQLVRCIQGLNPRDRPSTPLHDFLSFVSDELDDLRPEGIPAPELEASRSIDESQLLRSYSPRSTVPVASPLMNTPPDIDPPPLNYNLVKDDLLSQTFPPEKKAYVLQALRWRLIRPGGRIRRKTQLRILSSFVENDILGIRNPNEKSLLSQLVVHSEDHEAEILREYALRFVNILSSFVSGRRYLLESDETIPTLTSVTKDEEFDSISQQNAIGILQRFSLRRDAQTRMIDQDVIPMLVSIFQSSKTSENGLSEYTSQYGTALMMNLLLRFEGKVRAEECAGALLGVLMDLLDHPNVQVRTYVNGALYSALARTAIRQKGREIGLPEMLRLVSSKCSDEDIRRQLAFIQAQLDGETRDTEGSDAGEDAASDWESDTEYVEEEEFAEEEETQEESLPAAQLQGERLLCSSFLASEEEARKDLDSVNRYMEERESVSARGPRRRDVAPTEEGRPYTPRTASIRWSGKDLSSSGQNLEALDSSLIKSPSREDEPLLPYVEHRSYEEFLDEDVNEDSIPKTNVVRRMRHSFEHPTRDDPGDTTMNESSISTSLDESFRDQDAQDSNAVSDPDESNALPGSSYPVDPNTSSSSTPVKLPPPPSKPVDDQSLDEYNFAFATRQKMVRTPADHIRARIR